MKYIDKFFLKKPHFRRIVTRILEGNRNIKKVFLGHDILIHSIKEHGYLRTSRLIDTSAFLRDELPVIMNISTILNDCDTIVDIGANIGIYSIIFSRFKMIKKNIEIYAYEANPDTFERLQINANKYKFNAFNLALSNKNKSVKFVEGAVSHVFTSIENQSTYNFGEKVIEVMTEKLSQQNIKGNSLILKVDVEGHELEVLEGSQDFFDKSRIKAVFVDRFENVGVILFLKKYGFLLLNAQTLEETSEVGGQLLALRNL